MQNGTLIWINCDKRESLNLVKIIRKSLVSRRLAKWKHLFILIIVLFLMYYFLPYLIVNNSYKYLQKERIATNDTIILLWNNYFTNSDWFNYTTVWNNCKCLVTRNRSLAQNANAILFHWSSFEPNDLPEKYSNQFWIFYFQESPSNTAKKDCLKKYHYLFDCWATYRSDSDIYLPYGYIIHNQVPANQQDLNLISIKSKNRSVLWPVSNCFTPSKRESYVRELKKYIDVDIVGNCGEEVCRKNCLPKFEKDYKFYLSFENSLCKEYFTEKIIRVLNYSMIPITMSAADLTSILPFHSFINSLNYSPRELASYLHFLSNSEDDYNSYFKWKPYYRIVENSFEIQFCKICSMMKNGINCNKDLNRVKWWFDDAKCKSWQD